MAPFPEIGTNCISRSEVGWPVSRREPIDIRRGFPPKVARAIWRGAGRSGAIWRGRAPFGAAGRHLARPGAIWRESRGGHLEASAGRRWEADLELNGPRRAGGPGIASGRWLRDSIGIGDQSVSRRAMPTTVNCGD